MHICVWCSIVNRYKSKLETFQILSEILVVSFIHVLKLDENITD